MFVLLKRHWAQFLVLAILLFITLANAKPGKVILGNDNFSPELNPQLTLERSLFNPAWRSYRALGLPSDSEQSDLLRTSIFFLLSHFFPAWLISQLYFFSSLFIGVLSIGYLAQIITKNPKSQPVFLISSLVYLSSLITVWVYFYPVHLFVAAYAFLPLVLLFLAKYFQTPSRKNKLGLAASSLLLSTSALTATMFLVSAVVILIFAKALIVHLHPNRTQIIRAFSIVFSLQLFWLLPFIQYVQTNAPDLQNSAINREITTTTIENEVKFNTALNSLRYYFSWLDIQEDGVNFTYPYRDWYKDNLVAIAISVVPTLLALIAVCKAIRQKRFDVFILGVTAFIGWVLIKGTNPPLGGIFGWAQNNIPLFAQVFRWQSSKLWPSMALTLPVLVGYLFASNPTNKRVRKTVTTASVLLSISLCMYIFPFFKGQLSRSEIFVNVPPEYSSLASHLKSSYPNQRVFLAPEANTRYFRSYSWGFWGSTVLNYLLSNPIIEKALIIGSDENQTAFNRLVESMYSHDHRAFSSTLAYFDTPLVLFDKNADDSRLGRTFSYPYDWSMYEYMITQNPNLELVWQEGNLLLFKNNLVLPATATAYSHSLNPDQLPLLSVQALPATYSSLNGRIHTLYLKPSTLTLNNNHLAINSTFAGTKDTFSTTATSAQIDQLPLTFTYNTSLIIKPALPILTTTTSPGIPLDNTQVPVPANSSFISLGQIPISANQTRTLNLNRKTLPNTQVLTFSNTSVIQSIVPLFTNKTTSNCQDDSTPINQLSISEQAVNIPLIPLSKTCTATDITLSKPTLLEITFNVKSGTSTIPSTLCVHSQKENRCLNQHRSFYATPNQTQQSLFVDRLIGSGDNLVFFFTFQSLSGQPEEITISQPTVTLYQDSRVVTLPPLPTISSLTHSINVNPNDVLTTTIPVIADPSTLTLQPAMPTTMTLESFHSHCPQRSPTDQFQIVANQNGSFDFTTKDCLDGLYTYIRNLDPNTMPQILVYARATNQQGIPLEISLNPKDQVKKHFSQFIPTLPPFSLYQLVVTQHHIQDHLVEISSRGIGPNPSLNTLHELLIQPIPQVWQELTYKPTQPLTLKKFTLTPINNQDTGTFQQVINEPGIYTLPTATHENWRAAILNSKPSGVLSLYTQALTQIFSPSSQEPRSTTVNGWQQGWVIPPTLQGKYLVAFFWPNVLAYLGLTLGLLATLVAIFPKEHSSPPPKSN